MLFRLVNIAVKVILYTGIYIYLANVQRSRKN